MTTASIRTRELILEAARDEFSRHGLAGGRVDRIAKAAGATVQRIYAYYSDKQGLFDALVLDAAENLASVIGTDQRGIVEFAGTVFDYVVQHPANTRTMTWARLEREHEFFSMMDSGLTRPTPISAVERLQEVGLVTTTWEAATILEAIVALCERWHSSSPTYGPSDIASHRELVLAFARTMAIEPAVSISPASQ